MVYLFFLREILLKLYQLYFKGIREYKSMLAFASHFLISIFYLKAKKKYVSKYSYFKYQVIFFKLFNILASFQDYINKIFTKKLYILDNILIYIENPG